jgi:hypothetical protein
MSDPSLFSPHDVLAVHRSKGYGYWRHREDRRRARQPLYAPQAGQQPVFERIVDHENLLRAFETLRQEGGKAPGIDGLTYDDFSRSEIADTLRTVSKSLAAQKYRPYPTRRVLVPKSAKRFRELRLATIVDRTVAKALQEAISRLLDNLFLPGVFAYRPGRSTLDMLLAIEHTAIEQNRWVLAVGDVKDAFPSVRIADVTDDYRRYIECEQVLWLVEAVLRGHKGQAHTVGIDQGTAVGPGSFNLRLHHALDLPYSADPENPRWFRWADDLAYVCQSVSEGYQTLRKARTFLQRAGLDLKDENGQPANLKRQGASVQLLGYSVSYEDGRLCYALGRKAWTGLDRGLETAHGAADPGETAKMAMRGWLAAFGPAFEDADSVTLEKVLAVMARKGFREACTEEDLRTWLRDVLLTWSAKRGSALRSTPTDGTTSPDEPNRDISQLLASDDVLRTSTDPPAIMAGEAGCPGDLPGQSAPF